MVSEVKLLKRIVTSILELGVVTPNNWVFSYPLFSNKETLPLRPIDYVVDFRLMKFYLASL